MAEQPVERAAEAFAATLARLRGERRLSQKRLATQMGFDPSYVSHVEARRHRPTEDFARRAEAVLQAGGVLWQRFQEYDAVRNASTSSAPRPQRTVTVEQRLPPGPGLIVEHEHAELSFADGVYRCVVRRELLNAGSEPVTRYPARIAVDRFPAEPERSNRHYHDHPLRWDELELTARCGDEVMRWRPKHDRDAFKEVWLLFENDDTRFPLYPGRQTTIEYSYVVGQDKWGTWFQRAIRLPTRRLSVRLCFPASVQPLVWGVETSLTSEAVALRTPVNEHHHGDQVVFDWGIDDPALGARFRLEWRFRDDGRPPKGDSPTKPDSLSEPSVRMASAGIVQRGASVLTQPARRFLLPADAAMATEVVTRLRETFDRVVRLHDFSKGVGLAAPQIGLGWAAAVVRAPSSGPEPLVLLNPVVVAASADEDEQFEGCLSFFDVRGVVRRPLSIDVKFSNLAGVIATRTFRHAAARLVAHEIDHLNGLLYRDRMAVGAELIPVQRYQSSGRPWRYDNEG